MKVLLTGYSGFLGRHLENHLRREGYSIRILLHRTAVTARNLAKETEVLWGSLSDLDVVKQAVTGVQIVVHAAWAFSSPFVRRPTVNERAAELLLRESVSAGVDFFAFISSVAVYGMNSRTNSFIDETSPLIHDRNHSFVYPSEKVAVETLCRSCDRKSTKLGIFRPGPIFDDKKAPVKKIVRIAGRSYGIGFGGGQNHMAYIHAEDVARAVILWLKSKQGDLIVNVTPTNCMRHRDWYKNWGMVNGRPVKP
ncbi:MAG: NAD-dependent epimerase/dehydratase family protein, partial [Candidatus Hodarchaeota archaeon]